MSSSPPPIQSTEGTAFFHRRLRELGVERRSVVLLQIAVGSPHVGGSRERQFTHQSLLVGANICSSAPAPPASTLNHLDPEPLHRLSKLRQVVITLPPASGVCQ